MGKKIETYSAHWEQLANQLARTYVQIGVCRDCNHPVVKGYCCTFCNSSNP